MAAYKKLHAESVNAPETFWKRMANEHAACVEALLGDLSRAEKHDLSRLLDAAKASLRRGLSTGAAP